MFVLFLLLASASASLPPSCDSPVYCYGPLIHTVQMARIFNDSKTFVDMKMKQSEQITLENFEKLMVQTKNNPTVDEIRTFVNENFEAGNELVKWDPPDFNPEPKFLSKIHDINLRNFAKDIVSLWKTLARKIKPEVLQNPNQYSLIPLPNGFIIPGGRFKEIYYWDSYWIVCGLLISEMKETARGVIENFLDLVKTIGHIPNGSRIYYLQRSQPPLLTKMVDQYITYTNDTEWLEKNIDVLEEEMKYWIQNKQVRVQQGLITYTMYQYNAPSYGPRPESYREDVLTAESTSDPNNTYIQLKTAAESGWDFSSRWFFDANGGNHANLSSIDTTRLIQVDLNSFLYDAFNILSKLYYKIQKPAKAIVWEKRATALKLAINAVLWNKEAGIWQDFDLKLHKHRNYFYVSNIAPLWVDAADTEFKSQVIKSVLNYLEKEGIENFTGGTPASLLQSGEQWDMPNAWPPLQAIIIDALGNSDDKKAKALAEKLAVRWIVANHIGYQDSHEMFEKYDALVPGQFGGGGEYKVQAGFGWTNGLVLQLLEKYFATAP